MVSIRLFLLSAILTAPASGQLTSRAFDPANVPQHSDTDPAKKLSPEQRGDVFMARKMYREAIDAYHEAPQNAPVVWNKIGIAYHQLGDFAAARRNYERAIKLDKKYADAVNNVGTVLYAGKHYTRAISRDRQP